MNWLKNFMQGRNGMDPLSFTLIVFALVLSIIGSFFAGTLGSSILIVISYILLILGFFRAISKNVYKRQQEYFAFVRLYTPLLQKFHGFKTSFAQRKTHKFYTCPQCKQRLRLPKGKGNITITCPKCQGQFNKKT